MIYLCQDNELSLVQILKIVIVYSVAGAILALIGWYVAFAAIIAPGQQDNVNITAKIFRTDGPAEFHAAHFGHFPVRDDQPHAALAHELKSLPAV